MNILDSGPGSLTGMAAVIVFVIRLVVAVAKRWRATQDKAVQAVPPSPQYAPPPTDPAILARLDRAEHESALSVALHRERWTVDERTRELAESRAEHTRLASALTESHAEIERLKTQVKILSAGKSIADRLLVAREERCARLEQDLAVALARLRGSPVEISDAEYRDASQAGPLQDSLKTPLRPGKP